MVVISPRGSQISDLVREQVAQCGWCRSALLGMLEEQVLTAGSATCLPRAKSMPLPSALILRSCKTMLKNIPRSGFQPPNCSQNPET